MNEKAVMQNILGWLGVNITGANMMAKVKMIEAMYSKNSKMVKWKEEKVKKKV